MTRSTLAAANRTEVQANQFRTEYLVTLAFPGGTLRCTTANKTLTFGGNNYLADGRLISVGGISERGDGTQDPIKIILSGADSTVLTRIDDDFHYSRVTVYQGWLDTAHALVNDPHSLGAYFMSHVDDVYDDDGARIELVCENVLWAEGQRVDAFLFNDVEQKLRSTGDTFLSNLASLTGSQHVWGGGSQAKAGGIGGGGGIGSSINLSWASDALNSAGGRTTYIPSGGA